MGTPVCTKRISMSTFSSTEWWSSFFAISTFIERIGGTLTQLLTFNIKWDVAIFVLVDALAPLEVTVSYLMIVLLCWQQSQYRQLAHLPAFDACFSIYSWTNWNHNFLKVLLPHNGVYFHSFRISWTSVSDCISKRNFYLTLQTKFGKGNKLGILSSESNKNNLLLIKIYKGNLTSTYYE